ncbi:UDP-N-acetylmuramoyl-L-alanine--D-glutamate ligase [Candidatus Peregrinibacteria bacterium]|nr:UDP-N-acetylmuramoyl-L-alanine--D-glutamate ligase [Candidatus Peregrinibacteria bacterium]
MLKTDKIAIIGYGEEGKAVYEYLTRHGFKDITICDQKGDGGMKGGRGLGLPVGAKKRLGPDYLKNLADFDVIFRSPGVSVLKPEIAAARQKGAEVTSATKYFFEKCPCKIVGVTGTKGKGTTASLIWEMGKGGRRQFFLGGNIGVVAIEFLDKLAARDIVILELSSFQLQDLDKSPHIAVVLNTTSEHLDYHKNVREYLEAKEAIVKYQKAGDYAIFNKDYLYWKKYAKLTAAKKIFVSAKDVKKKFGEIEIALPGHHNLENIAAAVVVAEILKVPVSRMREVLKTWHGLEHRLEFVAEIRGAKYYNDSFATTPDSTIAAIKSFPKNNLILIAGGSEKFADYKKLGEEIVRQKNLRVVILIGQTGPRIEDAILKAEKRLNAAARRMRHLTVIRRDDFEDAVLEAYVRAGRDWVVVMSPASASFDMFKNYKERGKKFREIVKSFDPLL